VIARGLVSHYSEKGDTPRSRAGWDLGGYSAKAGDVTTHHMSDFGGVFQPGGDKKAPGCPRAFLLSHAPSHLSY
jgi:hypothetical protein